MTARDWGFVLYNLGAAVGWFLLISVALGAYNVRRRRRTRD